jgi:hypothetical protein
MSKNNKAAAARVGKFGGVAPALLALSIFINYVDRGNLAKTAILSAPLASSVDRLEISATQR